MAQHRLARDLVGRVLEPVDLRRVLLGAWPSPDISARNASAAGHDQPGMLAEPLDEPLVVRHQRAEGAQQDIGASAHA